ncbi:MAG: tetratricopeptide repeat protein [Phormidium sp.]
MELNLLLNTHYKYNQCNFFPKQSDLNHSGTKLFINLSKNSLYFGLFIVDESLGKKKFIQNVQNASIKEIILQNTRLSDECTLHFSSNKSNKNLERINRLSEWLKLLARQNSATKNVQASVHLNPQKLLLCSEEQLITQIKDTFEGLVILFLVSIYDEPLKEIKSYFSRFNLKLSDSSCRLGLKLYQQKNYKEAINKFDFALNHSPNLANAYNFRGKAKAESGDSDGAIADYNQLILIQPKNPEAYDSRGNIYYQVQNYEKAIADYEQAIKINPNFALAYYHLGLTYIKLDNLDKARENLKKSAEIFDKEEDMDNYEDVQRILRTIQLDYFEPSFTDICQHIRSKNLCIDEQVIRRYYLATRIRKFVILSGISGIGKTWLTKVYADAIKAEYLLVPVSPNWTTNEDLLGYINPISGEYHYTAFSRFLEKVAEEYKKSQTENRTPVPYHLVLDEMNLARVEYYFAKFLSAMEVRMREEIAEIELAPDQKVLLPPNLYFIGTVNMDETTHGFADKVYDRAQLIELEVSRDDLYKYLGEVEYRDILMQIWDEVHEVAPFAFRIMNEITTYVKEAKLLDISWENSLDEQLLQKILPKFKGADERVGQSLDAFVKIASENNFVLSRNKAVRMLDIFNKNGFTSYF